jgi:hypothetical protein
VSLSKSPLPIWLGAFVAAAQPANFQHVVVIFQKNRTPDNRGACFIQLAQRRAKLGSSHFAASN